MGKLLDQVVVRGSFLLLGNTLFLIKQCPLYNAERSNMQYAVGIRLTVIFYVVCMYIGGGKYRDGTKQLDTHLTYTFIVHVCQEIGGYEGKSINFTQCT